MMDSVRNLVRRGAVFAVVVGLIGTSCSSSGPTESQDELPTALSTVERRDLIASKLVNGMVSYGEPWEISSLSEGIVTRPIEAGSVIQHGSPLVWIDERPVMLLKGEIPMFRDLFLVSDLSPDENGSGTELLAGNDVQQLQQFLRTSGFLATNADADGRFGLATDSAVRDFQQSLALHPTGRLDRTQIVFAENALRIHSAVKAGSVFGGIAVTATEPQVRAVIQPTSRVFFKEGAGVTIFDDDDQEVIGVVYEVGPNVDQPGSSIVVVTIQGTMSSTAEVVRIEGLDIRAQAVLAVDARAIIALAGNKFAVELEDGEILEVKIGAQADEWIEIDGDIEQGTFVVVPE